MRATHMLSSVRGNQNHGVNISVLHMGKRCKPHRKDMKAAAIGRIQKETAAAEKERRQAWIERNGSHAVKKDKNTKRGFRF